VTAIWIDGMSEPIFVERASGERWEDLCGLFGRAGASNGCWCQYWLLGADYHRRDRTINKDSLRRECAHGRAPGPGLIAYRDRHAVGWARLSPRSELGWLNQRFAGRLPDSDDPWSLSCFYVPNRYRGAGVMTALISAAVTAAREAGVTIEAYPVDSTIEGATRNRFTGVLDPFLRAGFIELVRLTPDRALVRRTCSGQ
jgi:GNAT superfamily N-acetyltransferase